MTKMTTDERDDLKMWARLHVRGGYEPLEEIEEILLDYAQDFRSPLTERDRQIEVRNALVHAVSVLVQEQESWPVLTDFDRLSLAFDMLEDEDIVARQHFTCCGTCGAAEIGIEMDDFHGTSPAESRRAMSSFTSRTRKALSKAAACTSATARQMPRRLLKRTSPSASVCMTSCNPSG
jgi:hypothetical protein